MDKGITVSLVMVAAVSTALGYGAVDPHLEDAWKARLGDPCYVAGSLKHAG